MWSHLAEGRPVRPLTSNPRPLTSAPRPLTSSATPGFAQRRMSKFDTHHGATWRCDRLPPDTLQMSPKPIFGETGVQFAHLSLEGICCMRVPRRSRAFTSTQVRSQAPTSVRRHSQALRNFSSSRAFTARFQIIPNAPERSQTQTLPNSPKPSQTIPNPPKPSQTLPPGHLHPKPASQACLPACLFACVQSASLPPSLPPCLPPARLSSWFCVCPGAARASPSPKTGSQFVNPSPS